jgi:16S rRNA (cytosine967-C5)-methyltransferase
MSVNLRAEAARVLSRVFSGSSLDDALAAARPRLESPRDQALLQAIAYGVLRDRRLLEALMRRMLQRPLGDALAEALVLAGLYQLRSMRVSAHAAVAETVSATADLGLERLRGLVNALLRRFQRERDPLEAALPPQLGVKMSYPDWMVDAIRRDWPEHWEAVLTAGNLQAPMSLRVQHRLGREHYLQQLAAAGIAARALEHCADGVVLQQAMDVRALPGFESGAVSVQDASAQLAADLLDLAPGQRVLDACAAPGGKTAHALERCALDMLALDRDASRLQRVQENLDRLGLQATLKVADAVDVAAWWDGKPFDRILIDAPCSGTGVIRRHPDIKWLRRPSDIGALAETQLQLLLALWPLLAPEGLLVYASCSIFAEEGAAVCKRFLMQQPEAKALPIEAAWGEAARPGRRIAPGGDHDGFYYARFRKPARRGGGAAG